MLRCVMSLSKSSPKTKVKLGGHNEVPERALRGYFRWNLGTKEKVSKSQKHIQLLCS